jgi:hypothetical protein
MLRIHRVAVLTGLAVTLLALAPTIEAQVLPGAGPGQVPGPGPGGAMAGPRPGGMMGMGMGLGPGQSSPVMILLAPSVQSELKLTEEQKTKVYGFARNATQKHRDLMQQMMFGGNANPQAMMQANWQIRKENDQAIAQILQPKQKERLDQIVLQHEGPLAVARPEIAAKLRLNDTQQEYVQGVLVEMRRELMMSIRQSAAAGQFNPAQVRELSTQLRKQAVMDISQVIDAKQKKNFNSMLGAPFDLNKLETEATSAEAKVGGTTDLAQPGDAAQTKEAPANGSGTETAKDAPASARKKGRARPDPGANP